MERWRGKHALVTGASAGIGYAIVEGLLQAGVHVVACARNPATLHALKETLKADSGQLHPMKTDLTDETQILELFKVIEAQFSHVDILVNNAGIGYFGEVGSGSIAEWREMLNLNILSTTICTKETLRLLEKDGITTGHVININSIAGHRSIEGFNFYSGTKHMLTALTKALHVELANKKSKIRVTSLSPGLVSSRATEDLMKEDKLGVFTEAPALKCSDIADAVLYVLSVPLSVVITELTIVPNGEIV